MATAHLPTTYDQTTELQTSSLADGVFTCSAMIGAVGGALAGAAIAGPAFHDYARVLSGTFGVVFGSVIGATVGRFVLFPAWTRLFARRRA
jgi:hypothetical protein